MKLSVILPCFNGAETIAVQLEALTRQHWPGGWELIVVNNGSTDCSMDIVDAYRGRLPDLRIVQAHLPGTRRLGVPHSYNTGIQAATGGAFVFCEADDEVADGWLAAMGRALAAHPFVVARLDHRKLNAEWLHPPYGDGYQSAGLYRMPQPPHLFSASACGFGLQRALYEALGPLSTDFPIVHDGEYCWRAQLAGHAIHFAPDALVYYREKASLAARFRQGRSWGWDTTRLHYHQGLPKGRFAVLRQLVALGRMLPSGTRAVLLWALQRPRGRTLIADWVWNAGWAAGKLKLLVEKPAAVQPPSAASATAAQQAAASVPGADRLRSTP